MELDYCKIGLGYLLICLGTSNRRQRNGLKVSSVTTSVTTTQM